MDSLFDDDEDAEDEVIGQVLDEIGLEYTSKVSGCGLGILRGVATLKCTVN